MFAGGLGLAAGVYGRLQRRSVPGPLPGDVPSACPEQIPDAGNLCPAHSTQAQLQASRARACQAAIQALGRGNGWRLHRGGSALNLLQAGAPAAGSAAVPPQRQAAAAVPVVPPV